MDGGDGDGWLGIPGMYGTNAMGDVCEMGGISKQRDMTGGAGDITVYLGERGGVVTNGRATIGRAARA